MEVNDNSSIEASSMSEMTKEEEIFDYIENENTKKIKEMLSDKIPIWDFHSKENDNSTVLHISVFKKYFNMTELFIEYCKDNNKEGLKAFINEKNDLGITAIHYAAFRGSIKIIKLLIENGADINVKTNRELNIIHYSAQGNKPSSLMYFYLEFMKNNDYKLIKDHDSGGSTPLHWAAYTNSEDVLLYLIKLDIFKNEQEKQKYIDQQDDQGYTPLHLAISSKSSRIVMKLLQSGASPDLKDKKGRTPLDLAISKKQNEIVQILKNNQSCQICNVKAPVKQIKKSPKNIIYVFFFQIITTFILFVFIIPKAFDNGENDQNLTYKILFDIYIFLFLLFFILYLFLLIIDPGKMKNNSINNLKKLLDNGEDLTKYCYKCFIKKTRTSKHCIICDNCYKDFDHHCYWINKCVARRNYILFLFFLFETFLYLSIVLVINILGLIHYFRDPNDGKNNYIFNFYGFHFYSSNIITRQFKQFEKHISLIFNIILIIINLSFLIPEALLLILHIHVYCSNYKFKKNRDKRAISSSLIEASIMTDTSLDLSNIN